MSDSLNSESEEGKITMKKLVSLILCASLLISVGISPATAVGAVENASTFSLDKIDPEMSLSDALEQYPELSDIFYIYDLTAEEAQALEDAGVERIDGDEIPASILYSLNTREVHTDASISPYGSSQNGPWPYEQAGEGAPNCYGYALGISQACNPGSFAGYSLPEPYNVNQVADYVNRDMVATFNGAARKVNYQQTINSWEWRIATRVGSKMVPIGNGAEKLVSDYHFWLQTNSGTWCHKPGSLPSEYLGNVNPGTQNWDLPYWDSATREIKYISNFYDSLTVYMALYRMD